MKTKPKSKREWSISVFLSLLTTILITVIILSLAGYVSYYAKAMSINAGENIKNINYSLASLVFRVFADDYKDKNFSKLNLVVNNLETGGMLSYAYVFSPDTNKIIWADNNKLVGLNSKIVRGQLVKDRRTHEITGETGQYTVVLGFVTSGFSDKTPEGLLFHLQLLLTFFIIVGGLSSAVLIRTILNSPLTRLAQGVGEFANGNLKHRIPKDIYREMNDLIDTYNYMAFQLSELYESLELKVQERTIELERANSELKDAQVMMVHSEKMRSLGELVAGIAHEINNPVNFIHGNLMHLENYSRDMLELINMYNALEGNFPEDKKAEIQKFRKHIDIDFLRDDIKDLIKSCKEGTERTKNIVLDLKNFSRLGEVVLTELSIPKEIDTTLNILNNKIKDRITVHKDYSPDLPRIEAYGGQLNQVFMNILDNAQYAIKGTGDIYIGAKLEGENVVMSFRDTGCGMSQKDLAKVFEPFYTTKPVGEGTGMGMSITYKVIQNHKGSVKINSEEGAGTTFTITLPVNHSEENSDEEELVSQGVQGDSYEI